MSGRLHRSTTDRMISGVAGGVADYLDVDPALVRIVWAVLIVVTGGLFFLIYIVMWIVVPEGPGTRRSGWQDGGQAAASELPETAAARDVEGEPRLFAPTDGRGGNTRLVVGLILIALGAYFLLREYLPVVAWDRFWPVLLVLAGVALLVASMRHTTDRR